MARLSGHPSGSLGDLLFREAARRGTSVAALVKSAHLSASHVYTLTSGRRHPNPKTVSQLALALGIDVAAVMAACEKSARKRPRRRE